MAARSSQPYHKEAMTGPAKKHDDAGIIVYNWNKPTGINGKKPYSVKFGKENGAVIVKTWKELLQCVFHFFASSFPDIDVTLATYGTGRRKLCSYDPNQVAYAAKLQNGLYIDSAWSANDVAGITRAICDHCGYNIAELEICYRIDLSTAEGTSAVNGDRADEEARALNAFRDEFPVSMDLGFVDLKRLKSKYESMCGCALTLDDASIYALIRSNGIKVDSNRYTHVSHLVPEGILRQMREFIDSELKKASVHRVYARPLFDTYKSHLSFAMNEELLLTIIEMTFGDTYKVNRKSMCITCKDTVSSPSANEEIKNAIVKFLAEDVQPFTAEEIAAHLPSYPKWKIEAVLSFAPEELVAVSGRTYAHIEYVYMEQNDIERIKALINEQIAVDGFISEDDLYTIIAKDVPNVIGMNPDISKPDILKVIKRKVREDFAIDPVWQGGAHFLPKGEV